MDQNSLDLLNDATYKNTNEFLPSPGFGKVVKVYDGDTIWVATVINGERCRVNVRMLGYDCAEMRSSDDVEKKCAHDARDDLNDMIMDKIVNLEVVSADKYGRLLANVTYKNANDELVDVNSYMLNKWGVAYDGGHKETVDWSTYPKL
jgi:endonuclease YncB( thermonuclease family)